MSRPGVVALTRAPVHRQDGQALIESLIAISMLGVLWGAIHWLSHYQDIALSAIHASRHVAFLGSRDDLVSQQPDSLPRDEVLRPVVRFFSGAAHRWTDRRASPVLDAVTSLKIENRRTQVLSWRAQPGGESTNPATLRREWLLEDQGVFHARVHLTFPDDAYPSLSRTTSILTNAGHAASDTATQARVGASHHAWAAAHARSSRAGRDIANRAIAVDTGWGRADPEFDWLHPWSGRVPTEYLDNYEGR